MSQWVAVLQGQWFQHGMAWTLFGLYLAGAWFISLSARFLVGAVIHRFVAKSGSVLDHRLLTASVAPVRFLVLMMGVRAALNALQVRMPAFQPAGPSMVEAGRFASEFGAVTQVVGALIILAATSLAAGMFRGMLDWYVHEKVVGNQSTWDEQLIPLIRRLTSLVLYFIAISIILYDFGYQITALITTAGVASLAVALAAQETLSNMLGGFVILVDRPFRVGDVIELSDGKMGEVVDIGLRSTRIRQFDGNAMVIPNKDMANNRIINMALPNPSAAIRATIGVGYNTDIEKAKQVLVEVLKAHPEVLSDPGPGVWFTKFGENSLDLFFSCWVGSFKDRFRVGDELNVAILNAFRQEGITIPFPQRDVHLHLTEEGRQALSEKDGSPPIAES